MATRDFTVAVVGATGAVGNEMIRILEERDFPVRRLVPLASERSAGKKVTFRGEEVPVQVLSEKSFDGVEIGLFSAGGPVSERFAPLAARAGCVVVDNTSAFRMDPEVPLVVPEVNPHAIARYGRKGIIANPNCSTIQMVVVMKPIHDRATIRRVVVSTYQSVSGTGMKAILELEDQVKAWVSSRPLEAKVYPYQIAFNCLPHIDIFLENGYTKEEMKMVNETRKIMEDEAIGVTATTVRVPVIRGHSEAINIQTAKKLTVEEAREILSRAPGVRVWDSPSERRYPMPILAAGGDETWVGRIREDETIENGLNLWVVSDNLRKGAALNAVQIAEILARDYLR
ncbi:MAG: aspartate-semialdehyde dehydrogenase [Thermodesulfobacteriota bacterium]